MQKRRTTKNTIRQRQPVWAYNSYRAALSHKGKPFAIVTPDGKNALKPEDAKTLLDALN